MQSIAMTESKSEAGHTQARHALEILTRHYPGYTWFVRVDGGIIDIKCAEIGRASMVRHIKKMDYDWGVFDRDIVRSAGEFLERAKLVRGASRGEIAKSLDGGERIKWQPRIS